MKKIVAGLFIIHFSIVFLHLTFDLFDLKKPQYYTGKYLNPLFTQSWSMFSKPPESDRILYYQFLEVTDAGDSLLSSWYNTNKGLNEYNSKFLFSLAQRLLKYKSAAFNNTFQVMTELECEVKGTKTEDILCLVSSTGFRALWNYAVILYEGMHGPSQDRKLYFRMKINEDLFPRFGDPSDFEENHIIKQLDFPFLPLYDDYARS